MPGGLIPAGGGEHPLGPSGVLTIPLYCRRDDYMFLPPTSLGGLPCAPAPQEQRFDPYALAVELAARVPPPELRIAMNPAQGMVAVPTWFWVEGYDGGTIGGSQTELEAHEVCHQQTVRDDRGVAQLDSTGRPRTRTSCDVETTRFTVAVRLIPSTYAWDFGDSSSRNVSCPSQWVGCDEALGFPYLDPSHPSPIQHPYQWSSLGINGDRDAYTIRLGITFGAEYEVMVNGSRSGWHSLPSRGMTWSANHQVREAQSVLTRP